LGGEEVNNATNDFQINAVLFLTVKMDTSDLSVYDEVFDKG